MLDGSHSLNNTYGVGWLEILNFILRQSSIAAFTNWSSVYGVAYCIVLASSCRLIAFRASLFSAWVVAGIPSFVLILRQCAPSTVWPSVIHLISTLSFKGLVGVGLDHHRFVQQPRSSESAEYPASNQRYIMFLRHINSISCNYGAYDYADCSRPRFD